MNEIMLGVLSLLLMGLGAMFVLLYNTLLTRINKLEEHIDNQIKDSNNEFGEVWNEMKDLTGNRVVCQMHTDKLSEIERTMLEIKNTVIEYKYATAEMDGRLTQLDGKPTSLQHRKQ